MKHTNLQVIRVLLLFSCLCSIFVWATQQSHAQEDVTATFGVRYEQVGDNEKQFTGTIFLSDRTPSLVAIGMNVQVDLEAVTLTRDSASDCSTLYSNVVCNPNADTSGLDGYQVRWNWTTSADNLTTFPQDFIQLKFDCLSEGTVQPITDAVATDLYSEAFMLGEMTFDLPTYDCPTLEPVTTNTPVPTATNTPMPTATNTPMPTATNTPMPTATNTPMPTATNTPMPTATNTPTDAPTATAMPTDAPTATAMPTDAPTATAMPTDAPTATAMPTDAPTATAMPTDAPTATGTVVATDVPTATGTVVATDVPTATGTVVATDVPTATGTVAATEGEPTVVVSTKDGIQDPVDPDGQGSLEDATAITLSPAENRNSTPSIAYMILLLPMSIGTFVLYKSRKRAFVATDK